MKMQFSAAEERQIRTTFERFYPTLKINIEQEEDGDGVYASVQFTAERCLFVWKHSEGQYDLYETGATCRWAAGEFATLGAVLEKALERLKRLRPQGRLSACWRPGPEYNPLNGGTYRWNGSRYVNDEFPNYG